MRCLPEWIGRQTSIARDLSLARAGHETCFARETEGSDEGLGMQVRNSGHLPVFRLKIAFDKRGSLTLIED